MKPDFTTHRIPLVLVAGLLLVAAGCNSDVDARQPDTTQADAAKIEADSPKAAFEIFKQAIREEDWPRFCESMTESGRKRFAVDLVSSLSVSLARLRARLSGPNAELPELFKPIRAPLEKHGLDVTELIKRPLEHLEHDRNPIAGDAIEEQRSVVRRMLEDVESHCTLIGDGLEGFQKTFARFGGGGEQMEFIKSDAKLEDVKIDEDSASATLVQTNVNEETQRYPIGFRKTEDGWKISEPPKLFTTFPEDPN